MLGREGVEGRSDTLTSQLTQPSSPVHQVSKSSALAPGRRSKKGHRSVDSWPARNHVQVSCAPFGANTKRARRTLRELHQIQRKPLFLPVLAPPRPCDMRGVSGSFLAAIVYPTASFYGNPVYKVA